MASYARNKKNRRDNFSETTLKILCRRAGGKCCKCGVNTIGPVANNPYQTINIGKGTYKTQNKQKTSRGVMMPS